MKFYNIERKLFVVHIMNIIFQMQRRWCIDATNFSQDYEWEAAELGLKFLSLFNDLFSYPGAFCPSVN